jgi:hypothetical protein
MSSFSFFSAILLASAVFKRASERLRVGLRWVVRIRASRTDVDWVDAFLPATMPADSFLTRED